MKKIAILGFGASGLFSALSLDGVNAEVDVFDIGPHFKDRKPCPRDVGKIRACPKGGCKYCSVFWSGGIYNDGKMTCNASPNIGGELYHLIGETTLQEKIDEVIRHFRDGGADKEILRPSKDDVDWITAKCILAGMMYGHQDVLHVGSDRLPDVILNMFGTIRSEFNYRWNTPVKNVFKRDDGRFEVISGKGQEETGIYDYVLISAGRSGSKWLVESKIFDSFETEPGKVDIGVRVETSDEFTRVLNERFYDWKLYYKAPRYRDLTRTFCVNPSGFVCIENNGDFSIVNGHAKAEVKSQNTNFAVLVSMKFTEPFKSPVKYGNAIASLANMLGDGPLVQRLGDMKKGRRTKTLSFNSIRPTLEVECGDLSLAIPHRLLASVQEFLDAMDRIVPGVAGDDTLLYGVEAKYFTDRISLTKNMEVIGSENCFVIGDISGHTRGISQSAVSGLLAGREVKKRIQ